MTQTVLILKNYSTRKTEVIRAAGNLRVFESAIAAALHGDSILAGEVAGYVPAQWEAYATMHLDFFINLLLERFSPDFLQA